MDKALHISYQEVVTMNNDRLYNFNFKIIKSIGRKDDFWDTGIAGSFFKTLKYEWLSSIRFTSHNQS